MIQDIMSAHSHRGHTELILLEGCLFGTGRYPDTEDLNLCAGCSSIELPEHSEKEDDETRFRCSLEELLCSGWFFFNAGLNIESRIGITPYLYIIQ